MGGGHLWGAGTGKRVPAARGHLGRAGLAATAPEAARRRVPSGRARLRLPGPGGGGDGEGDDPGVRAGEAAGQAAAGGGRPGAVARGCARDAPGMPGRASRVPRSGGGSGARALPCKRLGPLVRGRVGGCGEELLLAEALGSS